MFDRSSDDGRISVGGCGSAVGSVRWCFPISKTTQRITRQYLESSSLLKMSSYNQSYGYNEWRFNLFFNVTNVFYWSVTHLGIECRVWNWGILGFMHVEWLPCNDHGQGAFTLLLSGFQVMTLGRALVLMYLRHRIVLFNSGISWEVDEKSVDALALCPGSGDSFIDRVKIALVHGGTRSVE